MNWVISHTLIDCSFFRFFMSKSKINFTWIQVLPFIKPKLIIHGLIGSIQIAFILELQSLHWIKIVLLHRNQNFILASIAVASKPLSDFVAVYSKNIHNQSIKHATEWHYITNSSITLQLNWVFNCIRHLFTTEQQNEINHFCMFKVPSMNQI